MENNIEEFLNSPEVFAQPEEMKTKSKGFEFTLFGRTFTFSTFLKKGKPPGIFTCDERLCDTTHLIKNLSDRSNMPIISKEIIEQAVLTYINKKISTEVNSKKPSEPSFPQWMNM
jgi:hypothetical protein